MEPFGPAESYAGPFDAVKSRVKRGKAEGLSDQTLTGPLRAAAERSSVPTFHPVIPGILGLSVESSTPIFVSGLCLHFETGICPMISVRLCLCGTDSERL